MLTIGALHPRLARTGQLTPKSEAPSPYGRWKFWKWVGLHITPIEERIQGRRLAVYIPGVLGLELTSDRFGLLTNAGLDSGQPIPELLRGPWHAAWHQTCSRGPGTTHREPSSLRSPACHGGCGPDANGIARQGIRNPDDVVRKPFFESDSGLVD